MTEYAKCNWAILGIPHPPHEWDPEERLVDSPCPGVPAPEGVTMDDAALREKVAHIVKGIVSYDHEEAAIEALMGLFAQHHCASCDMHSCGDLTPGQALERLITKLRGNDGV